MDQRYWRTHREKHEEKIEVTGELKERKEGYRQRNTERETER